MHLTSKRTLKRTTQRALWGYGLISPWIIGFCLFFALPLVYSLYMSFSKLRINKPPDFVGLKNYVYMFTSFSRLWVSVRQTLLWTVACTAFNTVVSLVFATLIFQKMRFQTTVRAIFYLPVVINAIAIATVFRYLTLQNGWVNGILEPLGIGPIFFWDTPVSVFFTVLMAQIFSVGGTVVIYLAGLSNIGRDYYEAATVDGAGQFRQFFTITLPMLSSIIYFNIITNIIFIFGSFNVPLLYYGFQAKGSNIAYQGGPQDVLYHLGLMVYNLAFNNMDFGLASAVGWLMIIISLVLVALVYYFGKKLVYYES